MSKSDDGKGDKKGDIVMPLFEALVFWWKKKLITFLTSLYVARSNPKLLFDNF
jgi:hypothetical protein